MNKSICIIIFLIGTFAFAQETNSRLKSKDFHITSDTIQIDSISISPYNFKVFDELNQQIDSTNYTVDFAKSILVLDAKKYPIITVEYQSLPTFLTKTYSVFDKSLIVPRSTDLSRLYSVRSRTNNKAFAPFDGLNTSGSISRGVTVGNNQDATVNSNLDLQISGRLSDKVQLRASITDSNIPLQENGYTQRLDEFDRVFIEMFSDNWSVTAGDINLQNTESQFLRFNKKVAGLQLDVNLENEENDINIFASGALVRGQFSQNQFIGQEGNQGPYKITGTNPNTLAEQYVLLISGSERVFVNGILLKRGENNDYIIDYNTAEITFMPTYPITANMRITVEYQQADRNYTRFVTYNGAEYKTDKFNIGFNFYNENDAKNQSLQQDLSNSQKEILSLAGDDISQMNVSSAYADAFEEHKILYRKEIQNGEEVFVFSNDENDNLFNVRFTSVGSNNGNYRIQTTIASGRIYEYVAPINGVFQGDYEPVIQLIAPEKLQIAVLNMSYNPNKKTSLNSELAYSVNDKNLFSSVDDNDNKGVATKLNWQQLLSDKKWQLKSTVNYEFIQQDFKTIERFRNIEFARDWDLINPLGNQQFLSAGLSYANPENGKIIYGFDWLNFSKNYNGVKHNFLSDLKFNKTKIDISGSYLNNDSDLTKTQFLRGYANAKQHFKKSWVGIKLNGESNERKDKQTNTLSSLSHKFIESEAYVGVGDTAKVYAEFGYNYRLTDSVQNNRLTRINNANTYFLRSQLIQSENANLSLFVNYRTVNHENSPQVSGANATKEESLNSRLSYRQQLFKNAVTLQTGYETNSGNLPQQEYSYIEVDTGLGFYTWNDYNNNGIQELDEFEVAQFQDEANYVRVLLPTINFVKTHRNKFSQSLTIYPANWSNQKGVKKVLSYFTNQSFILIDSKKRREGANFELNPFSINNDVLSLTLNLKNSLFYNRGKQRYSTTYTYISTKNKNSFSIGDQEQALKSHQLLFNHRIGKFWLFDFKTALTENKSASERFSSRNYTLENTEVNPKISYLYSKNSRLEVLYHYKNKDNQLGNLETLTSHNFGANFIFAKNQKYSINSAVNLVLNTFDGNLNSPVAYQMLEGLQPGTNYTWNLSLQKRITSYLDLNINYLGRKSETANAIHTGTVQLRASF
ncbi:hypothetical protein UMM65_02790 [Aureibaculum sp. 2210JD6-5]|uniref:hypothetical protein n=1 Tax=Aureibaculum sp. 2210JD6-5 TaxID=3103957 RepID=UPI002AACFFD5|nr:hypothetical protein [Aureibaculum sp. 2210JD6-5]MDY7394153.1 hypothetical protein [Aureibaculum sp. 2210JD6-5]